MRLFGWCLLLALLIVVAFTLVLAWPEAHETRVAHGTLPMRIGGWLEYWLLWGIAYSGTLWLILAFALAVTLFAGAVLWQTIARFWTNRASKP